MRSRNMKAAGQDDAGSQYDGELVSRYKVNIKRLANLMVDLSSSESISDDDIAGAVSGNQRVLAGLAGRLKIIREIGMSLKDAPYLVQAIGRVASGAEEVNKADEAMQRMQAINAKAKLLMDQVAERDEKDAKPEEESGES